MLTQAELDRIDALLNEGLTPEQVADQIGVTRNGLTFKLLSSGKKVEIFRRLVDARPLDVAASTGQLVDVRA